MRRVHRLALIGLSSGLLACTTPLSPDEVLALGRAEARWAARSFQAYSYEHIISCGLCPDIFRRLTRVSVNNGQVVGVVVVANDSLLPAQQWTSFTTVEGLFDQIRQLPHEDGLSDVRVEFDPRLGYPTLIATFAKRGLQDGGGATYIRKLVPILTLVPTP